MENEIQKQEAKSKSILDILKGTILGLDGEGSAKRATSFYIIAILITAIHAVYLLEFRYIVHKPIISLSEIDKTIVNNMTFLIGIDYITVWLLLGLATLELIMKIIQVFKGQKPDEAK